MRGRFQRILILWLTIFPAAISSLQAQTPAIMVAPPPVPAPAPVTALDAADAPSPKPPSLFFSADELDMIRRAVAAHERFKMLKLSDAEMKANDFLNQLTASGQPHTSRHKVEKWFMYPQFLLESLAYHTPQDWSVIISGRKFSSHKLSADPELMLFAVDKEKVKVAWKPKDMAKVNESWLNNHTDRIEVDDRLGIVTFTLLPNQTFSSYAMRVLEGKVEPVVVKVMADVDYSEENTAPAAQTSAAPDGRTAGAEDTDVSGTKDNVGLKGLHNVYKAVGLEK